MAKGPPSQMYGTPSGRFWRNVVLIALAHVALIAGFIRWSVAARASPNPESIVWLGGNENLAPAAEKKNPQPTKNPPPLVVPKEDEPQAEKPLAATVKSEIELPSAT